MNRHNCSCNTDIICHVCEAMYCPLKDSKDYKECVTCGLLLCNLCRWKRNNNYYCEACLSIIEDWDKWMDEN